MRGPSLGGQKDYPEKSPQDRAENGTPNGDRGKMTEIPKQFVEIAQRLRAGDTTNQHKVRKILEWFGATRRGAKMTSDIRAALAALDLQTQPDIEDADIDDPVRFVLATPGGPQTIQSAGGNVDLKPIMAASDDSVETLPPSDDYLEPEPEDEQIERPDDRPVISQKRDWTISVLREKWDTGSLLLRPAFQREYVWTLRPDLPSRLIESLLLEISHSSDLFRPRCQRPP